MHILTRTESAKLGYRKYLGTPCQHGHADAAGLCERYTLNSACVACVRDNAGKRREHIRALLKGDSGT